jgi:hypothetical protein
MVSSGPLPIPVPLHPRIAHLCKILQEIVHFPFSNSDAPVAYNHLGPFICVGPEFDMRRPCG